MDGEIKNIADAIRQMKLLSDEELATMESRLSGRAAIQADDVKRLITEYLLCRSLLSQALGQRERIMQLSTSPENRQQSWRNT